MGRRMRAWLTHGESGQALVEAAIVLPVLLVLVFGVVMAGRVVHAKIAVQAAARQPGDAIAGQRGHHTQAPSGCMVKSASCLAPGE